MINNSGYTSMDKAHANDIQSMLMHAMSAIPGYDAEKSQVLKNVNGTLTWVDESEGS